MRISCDERDRGFQTYRDWGGRMSGARVLLDGTELKGCITADEELGEVLIWVTDGAGVPIVDGDQLRTEWRRGKVEIVMPEREAA